jgi:hypothetical protein
MGHGGGNLLSPANTRYGEGSLPDVELDEKSKKKFGKAGYGSNFMRACELTWRLGRTLQHARGPLCFYVQM